MLVLSRQRDETIMIGDDIEVTVVDIRGDKVRLGISAPKEIAVHRKEVYEAIKRENRAAAEVKLKPEDIQRSSQKSDLNRPTATKLRNPSKPIESFLKSRPFGSRKKKIVKAGESLVQPRGQRMPVYPSSITED